MKGALRVVVLLFTMFPLQRWLGSIALLLLAVACFGYPAALLGLILPLLAPVLTGGVVLRNMCSPRTLCLVPHGRVKLLCGVFLSALLITLTITLLFWAIPKNGALPVSLAQLVAIVAGIVSVALIAQFVLAANSYGVMLWLVLLGPMVVSLPWLRHFLPGKVSAALFAGIAVGCWLTFTIWFLRAPGFSTTDRGFASSRRTQRAIRFDMSSAAALRVLLLGQLSVGGMFLAGAIGAGIGESLGLYLFSRLPRALSLPELMTRAMVIAVGVSAFAGFGGFMVTRRSRHLWLKGGLDRAGLFDLCERYAWRSFGATALPFIALPALAWLHDPAAAVFVAQFLLVNLSAAACMLYLGLMHIGGWVLREVLAAIALLGTWLTLTVVAQFPTRGPLLIPAILAGAVVIALALRAIAQRRWRRIDWLICRPPPSTSQGLRIS